MGADGQFPELLDSSGGGGCGKRVEVGDEGCGGHGRRQEGEVREPETVVPHGSCEERGRP